MDKNIVLIGMSGCGKTTIGKMLAKELNMDFADTDEIIEKEQKRLISDIFNTDGEAFFRCLETKCAQKVSLLKNTVISTGGGIILNEDNMNYLRKNAVIFYLKRSVDSIKTTVDTSNRPLLSKDIEKLYEMEKIRGPLYEKYADLTVSNLAEPEKAVKTITEYRKSII
ncbi:MAG: shikimate kinase [Clostridia bacterium]|nr:shikimate kinase [Clostridia bacterium]